jgi:HEAT repeat protein
LALLAALEDTAADVRITAAETLAHMGDVERALPVLEQALRTGNVFVRLGALNAALRLGPAARPLLPAIREAKIDDPDQKETAEYVGRMVDYLPRRLDA